MIYKAKRTSTGFYHSSAQKRIKKPLYKVEYESVYIAVSNAIKPKVSSNPGILQPDKY